MPAKPTLAKFNGIVKKLARSITERVKKECQEEWKLAYADMRFPANGDGSWIEKLRVELADGATLSTMSPKMEQSQLVMKLVVMKDSLFEPKWYGLKITVFPDGRFETKHNLSASCFDDPTFFED